MQRDSMSMSMSMSVSMSISDSVSPSPSSSPSTSPSPSPSSSTSSSTSLPDDLLAHVFAFASTRELSHAYQLNKACQILCTSSHYWYRQLQYWFGERYIKPEDRCDDGDGTKMILEQVPAYKHFKSLWLLFDSLPQQLSNLIHAQRLLRAESVAYIRAYAWELEPLLSRIDDPIPELQPIHPSSSMSSTSSTISIPEITMPKIISRLTLPHTNTQVWQHFIALLSEARVNQMWRELTNIDELQQMEYGATLVARTEYPWLTLDQVSHELSVIAGRVQDEMAHDDSVGVTLRSRLELLNRIIFDEFEFRGNEMNYYAAANSCINRVLATRLGIPISLSVVYMCVAARVGIHVQGMNTPSHFLMRAREGEETYYIDAFNGGRLMSAMEVIQFLHYAFTATDLERSVCSTPPYQLFIRMYNNLLNVYHGPPLAVELDRHSMATAARIHHCSSQVMELLELSGSPARPAQQAFLNRFRIDALVASDPSST